MCTQGHLSAALAIHFLPVKVVGAIALESSAAVRLLILAVIEVTWSSSLVTIAISTYSNTAIETTSSGAVVINGRGALCGAAIGHVVVAAVAARFPPSKLMGSHTVVPPIVAPLVVGIATVCCTRAASSSDATTSFVAHSGWRSSANSAGSTRVLPAMVGYIDTQGGRKVV